MDVGVGVFSVGSGVGTNVGFGVVGGGVGMDVGAGVVGGGVIIVGGGVGLGVGFRVVIVVDSLDRWWLLALSMRRKAICCVREWTLHAYIMVFCKRVPDYMAGYMSHAKRRDSTSWH